MGAVVREFREMSDALRWAVPARVPVALRGASCVALPLLLGLSLGRPDAAAAMSFGALAGHHVQEAPYAYRARVVAAMGIALALAVVLGGIAGRGGIAAAVLVAGLVCGLASFACQAAQLPPPRELMLVLVVLVATDIPASAGQVLRNGGLALVGAALAWLVAMSPILRGRVRGPEEQAVSGAYLALAALLDAIGTPAAAGARHDAVLSVRQARRVVAQGGLSEAHPLATRVIAAEALLEAVLHVSIEAAEPLDRDWGEAVRALAHAAGEPGAGGRVRALPAQRVVGGDQLECAIENAADTAMDSATETATANGVESARSRRNRDLVQLDLPPLPAWPSFAAQLRTALTSRSLALPSAARLGLVVAVGLGAGRLFGLGHAYWIGLTSAAVLQGSNLLLVRRRIVHRLVGTVVGVVLTGVLLLAHPPFWGVAIAAVVFQGFLELIIPRHYGLAVVAITGLALCLFHLGAPAQEVPDALGSRLLDTAVGAVLALAFRLVLWPAVTAVRLPATQAATLRAVRRVYESAWCEPVDPRTVVARRRELQAALATLRMVSADVLADAGPQAIDFRWPVTAAIEELALLALSLPRGRPIPDRIRAAGFLSELDGLIAAIEGGALPPPAPTELSAYPRTVITTAELHAALHDLAAVS